MDLRIPVLLIALLTAAPAFAQTKPMTPAPEGAMGAMPVPGAAGGASPGLGGGLSAPDLTPSLGGVPTAPPVQNPDGQPAPPAVVTEAPAPTQEANTDTQVGPPTPPEEPKDEDGDEDRKGLSLSWWQVALIVLAVFAVAKILPGRRERR